VIVVARTCSAAGALRPVAADLGVAPPPRRPGLRAVPRWAAPSYGVIGQPSPMLKNYGEGSALPAGAALLRARGRPTRDLAAGDLAAGDLAAGDLGGPDVLRRRSAAPGGFRKMTAGATGMSGG